MTKISTTFLITLFIFLPGCDIPNKETTPVELPPVISDASVSPSAINVGVVSIPPNKNTVDTTLVAYVSTSDGNGQGNIATVSYAIITPDGSVALNGTLADNGIAPDDKANDGKYYSNIPLQFPKENLGIYQIQFQSTDRSGFTSVTAAFPVTVFNSLNHSPSISSLSAPDTIIVPVEGETGFIKVTITVADSDGLADIRTASLTIAKPPDSSIVGIYPMYDDGGVRAVLPFNIPSGDNIAEDGSYSLIIPVPSNTLKNIERYFRFTATDRSNAVSNTITKTVYFK